MRWDEDEFFERNCTGEVFNKLLLHPTWLRTPLSDLSLNPYDLDLDDPAAVARYVERNTLADNRTLATIKVLAMNARRKWEATHPAAEPFAGVFLTDEWRNQLRAEPETEAPDDGYADYDAPMPAEDPDDVVDVEARDVLESAPLEPESPAPTASPAPPPPPPMWDGPDRPAAGSYREVDRPGQGE